MFATYNRDSPPSPVASRPHRAAPPPEPPLCIAGRGRERGRRMRQRGLKLGYSRRTNLHGNRPCVQVQSTAGRQIAKERTTGAARTWLSMLCCAAARCSCTSPYLSPSPPPPPSPHARNACTCESAESAMIAILFRGRWRRTWMPRVIRPRCEPPLLRWARRAGRLSEEELSR